MSLLQKPLHFIWFGLVFCFLLATGCKKTEYEMVTATGNLAPDDPTIDQTYINNYVSRVYISLLGRKPLEQEYNEGLGLVSQNNFSTAKRKELVELIMAKAEYKPRWYEIARADLLNNLDTTQITVFISVFESYVNQPAYANVKEQLQYEIDRLKLLQSIPQQLQNNSINITELHKRCINNYFYDQINMGTENFVVSSFQHFFNRYPSQSELEKAKTMVDGFSSDLFYQSGKTKADYLSIFFASGNYYEGQVRELFNRYFFREPNSEEQSYYANFYKTGQNYLNLQKELLSSDEYAIR